MDLSQLSTLGKVAGVPGIALGAAVLLLGVVLAATNVLPEGWRGPVTVGVVMGVALLGVLAIRGWARGTRGDPDRTTGPRAALCRGRSKIAREQGAGGDEVAQTAASDRFTVETVQG
jgi:hypothetical protein